MRATRLLLKGEVVQRHEADKLLIDPGSAVLIRRGVLRSMAMACPDGCGDVLTINLDGRAGNAWRYYRSGTDVSLFPSVWRDSGCRSHFIVWKSRIYWCDRHDELEEPIDEVTRRVKDALPLNFTGYTEIADQLGLVPWAVLSACNWLCQRGLAEAALDERGEFRRMPSKGV